MEIQHMRFKQQGISLLEMLLAIILIATITTMAVRYFNVTTRSMRVSNSIKQIKQYVNLSYEWLQQQRQSDFSGKPEGTAITTQALIDANLIRKDDRAALYDPWGGTINVAPGADPSFVKITLSNIPQPACRKLSRQLQSMNHQHNIVCGSAYGNTFSGEF